MVLDKALHFQVSHPRTAYNLKRFLLFFIFVYIYGSFHAVTNLVWHIATPPLGLPDRVQRQWGQYSPWFPAETYKPPPQACKIVQANILQRHGARYPNADDGYDKSMKRLSHADKFKDRKLEFLKKYNYDLGTEELLPFGASQSFEAGDAAYKRYSHLISEGNIPFVRAAGKSRVIYSATNWTVGFAAASHQRYNPTLSVIIPEDQNNTLHDDCPNAGDGTEQKNAWLNRFAPPIAKRLKEAAPGVEISNDDVFNLMAMCPFETMFKQHPSRFCALFEDKEFKMFEYHGDVEKFYKTGYGEPLGPVQGVGYINELLARLTGRPVQDLTQHNDTLPFPLGRTMYADFTHENLMVAVYSAIGLFNISDAPLSTKKMDKERIWIASEMVPFSSRMVVEKLLCQTSDLGDRVVPRPKWLSFAEHEGKDGRPAGEYVRVFVNDAPQPLEFCGAGKDGICRLDAFVESQGYARENGRGDFEECYK